MTGWNLDLKMQRLVFYLFTLSTSCHDKFWVFENILTLTSGAFVRNVGCPCFINIFMYINKMWQAEIAILKCKGLFYISLLLLYEKIKKFNRTLENDKWQMTSFVNISKMRPAEKEILLIKMLGFLFLYLKLAAMRHFKFLRIF